MCSANLFVRSSIWGKDALLISFAFCANKSSSSDMCSDTRAEGEESVEVGAMSPEVDGVDVMVENE